MKPERRGGAERASIGSSTRHLSTPLRDRSDCINTPPARRNSPVSKLPRSCDHPSVLDLRSMNHVSTRLAAVSEEKKIQRRLRTRPQSQPRHEDGVATPDSQGSPVCDAGPGRRRRVLKTWNKGRLCKTNSPRLKGRRDISVSPTKSLLRIRRDVSVSPTKMALRVRRDISASPAKMPLRVRRDVSVSPRKARLAVRRKMLPVDAITPEVESMTPRHVLMNAAPVETVTESESPSRPVCNDQQKELAGVLEENQQDASEQDTDDVMTGELAIAARRKFCQLDGQYTTDGRKVRMASSRFNRRRPQRKASLRVPQRKVSLRRGASRKASVRGCKTLVKKHGVTNEEKVVSCGTADASQADTDSVLTRTCEDVDHSDANEEKHFDGVGAPSIVRVSSCKSIANTEDSPGRKRGLELKPSPDEAIRYSSLLSAQSAHVSSAKKLKLDGKHDVESVEPDQQEVTTGSVRSTRKDRLVASTCVGTSIPVYKANVSGLTGELFPIKVQKVKISKLNSGLVSSTLQRVNASGSASELTTTPVPKVKVAGLSTSTPVPKVKVAGLSTSTPVPKVKVAGLSTSTPVPKVKVAGLSTSTPVPKVKVAGLSTSAPVPKVKVAGLSTSTPVPKVKVAGLSTSTPVPKVKVAGLSTSAPVPKVKVAGLSTSTPVPKVKVPGLATRTPVQKVKVSVAISELTPTTVPKVKVTGPNTRIPVQKAMVEGLTRAPSSTPVQNARTSQPTTGLTSTSVQVVKVPGPAARTPMRVHFTGLKDAPPTQARQETQNTSEAAVTSTAEPPRPESARTDAPTMEHSPDETDSTEERQIRYHTQPVEGSSDSSPRTPSDAKRLSTRHLTQPITCDEKHDAEDGAISVVKTGGSVANRLAALQKSGEDDWRKRIGKASDPSQRDALAGVKRRLIPTPLADRPHSIAVDSLLARQLGTELADSLAASGGDRVRPSGIANRLSCLEGSQANWRNRVGETDVRQFTVEGKLSAAGKTGESPLTTRRRRIPKAQLNRESESSNGSTPTSPTKSLSVPFSQPNGARTPQRSRDASPSSSTPNLFVSVDTPSFRVTPEPCESDVPEPREVEVLKADDETFTRFFEGSTVADIRSERIEVTVDDFDHLFIESQDILMSARKARPQRRKTPGSRNPVKKLAARQDLQGTYTEVRTNVAERELRRIKRERVIGTVPLAQEALAGLASNENFSKVTLKKSSSFGSATPGEKLLPYKDLMLLHIKGRRHCQLRLVEPSVRSINSGDSGDCFLLVTPDRLFVWIGEYANVMEKAKANELSTYIYQKRDLGCKLSSLPDIIAEENQHFGAGQMFWELLGGQEEYKDPGPPEEDELYEECLEETTKVFLVQQEELVPVPEYSNVPLRHAMLNNKQVLVFDFGSEVYLWTGKQVPFAQRKVGLRLVQELWDKGYDYTGSDTNPFSPLHKEGDEGGYPLKADHRPDWALLGKVNANMETTAFKEKFIDWPDSSRLIKVKEPNDNGKSTEGAALELTSCDVTAMLAVDTSPVTLLLEGSNVGRGNTWAENQDGLRREFEVDTLSVDMWHVLEYEQYQMEPLCFGQLHDHDTYVIRWRYRITQSGMRDLKGNAVNRQTRTGRERCAYFFWQGKESSVTEKGASALMTVELDEERGPQVRVVQGKEPPCFINLFSDTVMVTHFGKREDADTNTGGKYRLYIVRNELATEAYLMEVTCVCASLRSRTSFLLLNAHTGWLGVWHGVKSSEAVRARAMELAQRLEKRCPAEVGLHPDASIRVKEMEEGKEPSQFWAAMDTNDRSVYDSLLSDRTRRDHTARLFYMSSVSGVFEAKEVVNSCHSTEVYSPFPFQQSDLYSASQPGLFLVDTQYAVYVWSGWWPEETKDEENVKTGSAEARFNIDRRCALETAINYCKEKNATSPPSAYLVYAGLEPLSFTNMFPTWELNEAITDINLAEGRKQDEMVVIEDLLAKLTCTKYPWAELQERPLPEGVDPLKLEFYLVENEFEELLGMSRSEFYGMPVWKQGNLKKEIGLF